jgi:hypothetical protein
MPEYIVKTFENRNLVIEADSFRATSGPSNEVTGYVFYKCDSAQNSSEHSNQLGTSISLVRTVANVSSSGVLAIVENDAWKGDFYSVDDLDEDDTDDVCKECRFSEFLNSEEFFNTVYDAVEVILNDDEPESEPKLVIEKWVNKEGDIQYGFQTPDGFIHFGNSREFAESGLKTYLGGEKTWGYLDLTGYTKVED